MHLAQHHFQAQARWFEDLTAFALSAVQFRPYGLVAAQLDAEGLLNGTVSLVHARGMLSDGTPFQFPPDEPPDPLQIGERFSPTRDAHRVLLALPVHRESGPNCVMDTGSTARVRNRMEERELRDETTGTDARRVPLARRNFQLLLDDDGLQDAGDLVTLPIARVRRDGTGHFVYDAAYIPPSVQIGASPRLLEILARLVDILGEKAAAMTAERARSGELPAEFAAREVASFWLSHAIHSAVAPLRHHLRARAVHPERLYIELARLAGALCTFALDAHPRDLPLYDHDEPERTFEALDEHIRNHLDLAIPTRHVRLPVVPAEARRKGKKAEVLVPAEREAEGSPFRVVRVTDARCLSPGAEWFLGVRSSGATADLISSVPRIVKICASRYVVRIVKEAYPGLGLEHVPAPPAALGPRVGMTYFRVLRTDPCWKAITDTGEAGVYIPAAIPDPELDVVVVPGAS